MKMLYKVTEIKMETCRVAGVLVWGCPMTCVLQVDWFKNKLTVLQFTLYFDLNIN